MLRNFIVFLSLTFCIQTCFSQVEVSDTIYKNQVAVNVPYLALGSINFSYERTLSKYFTIGLSAVNYGKAHKELRLNTRGNDSGTSYEINPFGRWYMGKTQRNSTFLEVFGSFNRSEDEYRIVRVNNDQGYGVYTYGIEEDENFGAGIGFGYRLLLIDTKLVLEAQFSLRTNFEFEFVSFDAEIVRTGIRVGYRF